MLCDVLASNKLNIHLPSKYMLALVYKYNHNHCHSAWELLGFKECLALYCLLTNLEALPLENAKRRLLKHNTLKLVFLNTFYIQMSLDYVNKV